MNLRNHKAAIGSGLAPFIGIPVTGSPLTGTGLMETVRLGIDHLGISLIGRSFLGSSFRGISLSGVSHMGIGSLGIGHLGAVLLDQPMAHSRRPPTRGRATRAGRCALEGTGRSGRCGAGPWGALHASRLSWLFGPALTRTPSTHPLGTGTRSARGLPSTLGDHHA